ncbi:MAG: RluA family pseudouridine synthase [Polyangiaceae bacterium]|nr:RluA family pseudouridine synthase [Polyangiaceae bacterium]
MTKLELVVDELHDGARLDKTIIALCNGASRARVKKAIEAGEVRVNGRILPKGGVVKTGDVISVDEVIAQRGTSPCVAEPDAPLSIRYELRELLIVDKPAGQPTAPLRDGETGTLANAILGHFPELLGVGYSAREPGIVHRLDTETSGLVVVARNAHAFDRLRQLLKDKKILKEYLLVCRSEDLPDEGTIEYPIANHPKDKKRVYPCMHPRDVIRYAPRPATTRYRVEERTEKWALVRAEAPRAIRHQIRVHFAAIEHPLAGDTLYGGEEVPGLERHALHAERVAYDGDEESDKGIAFDVVSPMPEDIAQLVRRA